MSRGDLHASKWCRGMKKRSIEEGRERENLISQLIWALLFTRKGGSCLNCKAAKVSSGKEPGT